MADNIKKVLLIGDKRICKQVAYVLDLKDYVIEDLELLDLLTKDKVTNLTWSNIYVCKFRKQCRQIKSLNIKNLKFFGG